MTAPEYVTRAAELLTEHGVRAFTWSYAVVCDCKLEYEDTEGHAAHQAEVLAAAGLIPTNVETRIDFDGCDDDCPGWWTARAPEGLRHVPCKHGTRQTRPAHDWKDASDD